jgi:predicted MFS family arabinose efflux permease
VIVAVAVAGVLLLGFLVRQRRLGPHALLDLGLFRIPTFSGAIALGFTSRLASLGLYPFLTLWLAGLVGQSPLQIGLTMMAISLPMAIVSLFSGYLARLASARELCCLGMTIIGAGLVWASAVLSPESGWIDVLPCLIVMGVGSGIVMPQLVGLAVGVVHTEQAGMASGLSNTFFPFGTSTGVALYGAIMAAVVGARVSGHDVAAAVVAGRIDQLHAATTTAKAELVAQAREAFAAGLSMVLLIAGVIVLVSAVVVLVLIRGEDILAAPKAAAPLEQQGSPSDTCDAKTYPNVRQPTRRETHDEGQCPHPQRSS